MPTEGISSRYTELDLWPTADAVSAMLEGQLSAAAAVQPQAGLIAKAADAAAARLDNPSGRLIYAGAGTSARIAVQDGVELGPTFNWGSERIAYLIAGGLEALMSSIEGAEDDAAAGEREMRHIAPTAHDVVIGVAASGTTPYTVAAVQTAVAAGALTIGLANNAGTPLLQIAAHPIFLDTGAEVVAGSTRMKAGTAQKIALNLFSTTLMLRLGRVYKGLMIDMRVSNDKLRRRAAEMICETAGVSGPIAEDAIRKADGDIKLATLLALGWTAEQSTASLLAAGGNLRVAIRQIEHGKRVAGALDAPS